MSTKRIPISVVRDLAKGQGLRQAILLGWDGKSTHVVTWGQNKTDCEQAALGGNSMKEIMGWPREDRGQVPSRVKAEQRYTVTMVGRVFDVLKLTESLRQAADKIVDSDGKVVKNRVGEQEEDESTRG